MEAVLGDFTYYARLALIVIIVVCYLFTRLVKKSNITVKNRNMAFLILLAIVLAIAIAIMVTVVFFTVSDFLSLQPLI